jgi:hypothetical protein
MTLQRIKLPGGEWQYDPEARLGPRGGFGEVFAAVGKGGEPLAIKRLKLEAGSAAHRELRLAGELAGRQFRHVMPILDAGQDAESDLYFVVMPRADKSLQDDLDSGLHFSELDAAKILFQIVDGLLEVPTIVHRDLKPGNVLFHSGSWKIADFGIARFVEESTSVHTLKNCLSPPYAAPEQWRLGRSTSATDLYALGCIAYALLTGSPPFSGPSQEEFCNQHLYVDPPGLDWVHPRLRSLLSMLLRKTPEARPTTDRALKVLQEIITPSNQDAAGAGINALSKAGASAAERAAQEEAKAALERSRREKREQLAVEAHSILKAIAERLLNQIQHVAPTATMDHKEHGALIRLGDARLEMEYVSRKGALPENLFQYCRWDVIALATIKVIQKVSQDIGHYEWGSSLWYTNLGSKEGFRWYEISYYDCSMRQPIREYEPFELTDFSEADKAAAQNIYCRYPIAYGPEPIDDENEGDFCDRWAELLARAYNGALCHPPHLPLE